MNSIKWLPMGAVLAMHARQLAEHGGRVAVRDETLLRSALDRPINKALFASPDLAELAAAYGFGIARNHPFLDGNKRTSLVATRTFLLINGYQVSASKQDILKTWTDLAAGNLTEKHLAAWLRLWMVEVSRKTPSSS